MSNREKFCLQWNDFEANIRSSFQGLREEQDYCDVTLACDDNYQVEAHKIILSAGSNFFREILRKNKHKNPLIYLKGIKRLDLENVIDFLYNGEAYVAQEDLKKFIETAQDLKVKGLQSNLKDEGDQNLKDNISSVDSKSSQDDDCNPYSNPQNVELTEVDLVGKIYNTFDANEFSVTQAEEVSLVVSTTHELDLQIEQMIEKNGMLWQCKVCGKTAKQKGDAKKHAEIHIESVSHPCHICNKPSSTRDALKNHIRNMHSQQLFNCNVCGKSGMRKLNFKNHSIRCQ